jgi:hypothetical protein
MPLTSTPLTTVDEPGIVPEADFFVGRGGVGGNAVVDYAVTICLREGESGQVKMREPMQRQMLAMMGRDKRHARNGTS